MARRKKTTAKAKKQSQLQKMAAAFNDAGITGMEDIDLEQDEEDLKEDFMSTIEEAEEKGKLKKVPKAAIKYYEQLVEEEEEEEEEEPEEEEETEEEEEEEEEEELEDLTLAQLKKIAKEEGITAAKLKGKRKAGVIKLIEAAREEEEEEEEEDAGEDEVDLDDMSLSELKAHAKGLGVKVAQLKGKKRAAIVKMIEAAGEEEEEEEEEEKPKRGKGKTGKRGKPSFRRGKDGYTREQSVCDVLKKSKKAIDPKDLGEMANELYTENEGSDNVKQSNTIATRALRYFRGIGVIKEIKGGKVKLDL